MSNLKKSIFDPIPFHNKYLSEIYRKCIREENIENIKKGKRSSELAKQKPLQQRNLQPCLEDHQVVNKTSERATGTVGTTTTKHQHQQPKRQLHHREPHLVDEDHQQEKQDQELKLQKQVIEKQERLAKAKESIAHLVTVNTAKLEQLWKGFLMVHLSKVKQSLLVSFPSMNPTKYLSG